MEEDVRGIGDYLDILWRRKFWVIIPAILLSIASVVIVFLLPATYKSEGTILIESQEIPHDLVRSTVTSYADQRIEIIKQKLMTTSRIMELVKKYNLYPDERSKSPATSTIVDLFRNNVDVHLVQADVTDPVSGRAKKASIAFTVSFMDKSPRVAQQVANELVTEFLRENVKTRTDRAADTLSFLKQEGDKFQKKVEALEKKIADFKDQYSNSLPELLQYNLSMIQQLQQDLTSNQNQILTLKDQISSMSIELSTIPPYLPEGDVPTNTDGKPSSAQALLEKLKAQYSSLTAKYEPTHPDVIRVKRQIQSLEKELGISDTEVTQLKGELDDAQSRLASLKERYSDSYPEVKSLKTKIANLQKQLKTAQANEAATEDEPDKPKQKTANNPAYIQLKAKIISSENEVKRLQQDQQNTRAQLQEYQKRVSQTHQVARAYEDLTRDHDNTLSKYKDLRAKQLQAELAQNLESENKGENFSLIEPPLVPSQAEKPNRPKLIAMGIVLSMGSGVGLALLVELLFGGVRGYNQIASVVGKAPLVVIPVITTAHEESRKKTIRNRWIMFVFLLIIAAVAVIHFYVINLEVLWFKVLRKISQF